MGEDEAPPPLRRIGAHGSWPIWAHGLGLIMDPWALAHVGPFLVPNGFKNHSNTMKNLSIFPKKVSMMVYIRLGVLALGMDLLSERHEGGLLASALALEVLEENLGRAPRPPSA